MAASCRAVPALNNNENGLSWHGKGDGGGGGRGVGRKGE